VAALCVFRRLFPKTPETLKNGEHVSFSSDKNVFDRNEFNRNVPEGMNMIKMFSKNNNWLCISEL
jgi:hypothetical protein